MNESSDVKSSSDEDITGTSRHHVLNDDILGLILNELPIEQLLRLEWVSNQFTDCVGSALKRKNTLSVCMVFNYCNDVFNNESNLLRNADFKDAVKPKGRHTINLIESKHTFKSILKKCPHIQSLFLTECDIDWQTIEVIINECPQLRRLYLDDISIESSKDRAIKSMKQLMSQLKHLTIRSSHHFRPNNRHLIDLTSRLLINTIGEDNHQSVNSLSQSLCSLKIHDAFSCLSTNQLINNLITFANLSQISLTSTDWRGMYVMNDQTFATLCDHLKLKSLSLTNFSISNDIFGHNISKCNQLRHLSINAHKKSFNINDIKSMPCLRSLSLTCITISPQMFANINQTFPQLKQLKIAGIEWQCECNVNNLGQFNECFCVHKCLKYLSTLSQLKRLDIEHVLSIGTDCNDLMPFIELNVLSLIVNCEQLLYDFIVKCIEKRVSKKCMRIIVDYKIKDSLMKRLNDTNVTIPRYLSIESNND